MLWTLWLTLGMCQQLVLNTPLTSSSLYHSPRMVVLSDMYRFGVDLPAAKANLSLVMTGHAAMKETVEANNDPWVVGVWEVECGWRADCWHTLVRILTAPSPSVPSDLASLGAPPSIARRRGLFRGQDAQTNPNVQDPFEVITMADVLIHEDDSRPLIVGDDDNVTQANALRVTMLASRKALKDATAKEASDTKATKAFVEKWGKSLALPVGGVKIFVTTYDGEPHVIRLTRPNVNEYGIQWLKASNMVAMDVTPPTLPPLSWATVESLQRFEAATPAAADDGGDEVNIDRNDPAYKRTKKKVSRWLLMLQLWAESTNDGDDDEVVAMATEFNQLYFDRLWALRHPKKK